MEDPRPLTRSLLAAAVGLLVLGGVLAGSTAALETWLRPTPALRTPPTSREPLPEPTLDGFLARELGRAGATLSSVASTDGTEVVRVPDGVSPRELGEALRRAALAEDIELYAAPLEDNEAEVRVYDGAVLLRRMVLRPTQTALLPAPDMPTLREQPLLGVVIAGLGHRPAGDLLEMGLPLTLAVKPFTPHSLRIAEDARLRWHEVLVELEASEAAADTQLQAVPGAAGALWTAAQQRLPTFDAATLPTVVHHGPTPGPALEGGRTVEAAGLPGASAREQLAHAWSQAREQGHALVVLQADDPTLPEALHALRQAPSLGYRLALASEVARWEDVRGLSDAESRAQAALHGR